VLIRSAGADGSPSHDLPPENSGLMQLHHCSPRHASQAAGWLSGLIITALFVCAAPAKAADAPGDFPKQGLPFLKKYCYECHDNELPEGSLSVEVFQDFDSLIRGRKTIEQMLRRIESQEMPPKDAAQPTENEVKAFASLIRGIYDHYDRNAKPDPGRVTVRRLNRVEYNNTIRDLVGVDFNPAEDFPSDDVGYGFDNIGDVLTLSPVLMERYLAAAESIMHRAIVPEPPAPVRRNVAARYVEPAGAKVPTSRFRPISTRESTEAIETGPLHTLYRVPADGEYIFRTRVFAKTEGEQPVRIAILAHGDTIAQPAGEEEVDQLFGLALKSLQPFVILKTVEVTATDEKNSETIEVKVPANLGLKRMAVALCKTPEGAPPAELHVEWLSLEGPLDPRPSTHYALLGRDADKPHPERTREVLTRFVTRAYRRPATEDEIDRLIPFVDQALADGLLWEVGMQRAMTAVLCSPKFLFRFELDDRPQAPEARPLDEFQLASRLSYFLWSTMPDDELLELAGKNQLTANLEPQVRRMLKDPKAIGLVDNFALQWLQLPRLRTFSPDTKQFPSFNDSLRNAMLEETRLFMAEVLREDRSLIDLIDARFTYLNEPLANLYGIADTNGNRRGQKPVAEPGKPIRGQEFVRVSLPEDSDRGGLLTMASVLTVTSNPTRTSPVKRGRWVLEQILGDPPPPPPPDVPELEEDKEAVLSGSLRQRMEQHRANPSCASCHARMDPIGFSFEHFNAIGQYRAKDGEFPIEAGGTLPDGRQIEGVIDLKQILKEHRDQFSRSVTEKMLIYALGRGLEYYDRPVVDRIQAAVAQGDYKVSTLVLEIVRSEPFRFRRGLEQKP